MLKRRLYIKIIAILVMVLCALNLILGIASMVRTMTSLIDYFDEEELIITMSSVLIPIVLWIPFFTMIRILNKPYKYWIQLGVNAIAISMFAFTFLRGLFNVIILSIGYSYDVSSIVLSSWSILFSIIFFVFGIIASKAMMKRRKICDIFYVIIIGISFLLYIATAFLSMGGSEPNVGMVAIILLLTSELALAIANLIERESIEEFNEFLDAIEHKYQRLYTILTRNLEARQSSINNVSKKTTKDSDANDNQQDDNAYQEEKIWEERGMIFSNKEQRLLSSKSNKSGFNHSFYNNHSK